ncbi:hypothetical protein ACLKA6_002004 [Drosophila palustris]
MHMREARRRNCVQNAASECKLYIRPQDFSTLNQLTHMLRSNAEGINEQVDKWTQAGAIEPSLSPHNAPTVLV